MEALRVIERVASKIAPGPTPFFTEAHGVKALEIISIEKSVGRKKLSEVLSLGEGTIRTLVKHLKKERLIKVSKAGITLSKFGQKIYAEIRSRISEELEIPKSPITIGPSNIAILIRNAANSINYGVEQRDAAIRAGALGATTLVFRQNKLIMPGVDENISQNIQPIYNTLISKLKPKENDVIIIGSANEKRVAELGAKTAALELLKCEK